jgi:hypothetical protein
MCLTDNNIVIISKTLELLWWTTIHPYNMLKKVSSKHLSTGFSFSYTCQVFKLIHEREIGFKTYAS